VQGVVQVDLDGGVVVLAPGPHLRAARTMARAEQRREELAERRVVVGAGPAELEPAVPVGRRTEIAAGRDTGRQIVVGGPFLGILQHLVGLVDVAHALLGVGLLADVRMVLAGQLAVGMPDIVVRRPLLDAQRRVVVLELHSRGLAK